MVKEEETETEKEKEERQEKDENPFYDFLEMCLGLAIVALIMAVILFFIYGRVV